MKTFTFRYIIGILWGVLFASACTSLRYDMRETHRRSSGLVCRQRSLNKELLDQSCAVLTREACELLNGDQMDALDQFLQNNASQVELCWPLMQLMIEMKYRNGKYQDAMMLIRAIDQISELPSEVIEENADISASIDVIWQGEFLDLMDQGRREDASQIIHLRNSLFPFQLEWATREVHLLSEDKRNEELITACQTFGLENLNAELLWFFGKANEAIGNDQQAVQSFHKALEYEFNEKYFEDYTRAKKSWLIRHLPDRIKNINDEPWVTREDFAALVVWRFNVPMDSSGSPVMIDISDSWAGEAIRAVVTAGIMDVGRDHRFMPKRRIRRMELALALHELILSSKIDSETTSEIIPSDILLEHYAYDAVIDCLRLGLLELDENGNFQGGRAVSGEDVLNALMRLGKLIDRREFD